jgi:hypothetical protein
MNKKKIFSIFLSLSLTFLFFSIHERSQAGLFGGNVPEGKEVKDPYMEKLFAPEFPFESIKVIETKEGKRYVIVKAKEKVNDKKRVDYEYKTLRNRGIVIFASGSPRTKELLISEMRLYRVASEKPYVVEYCEVIGDSFEREPGVESVVRNEGKYLIIRINKNFGKTFKRVEIYPEKETKCPEPPFVGKYPNSRCVSYTGGKKGNLFVYVTKDNGQEIYDYYKDKLKAHYIDVGFNFPEKAWKFGNEFGIQIKSSEVARVGTLLDQLRKDTSIAMPPPSKGVVFHIVITQVGLNPIIKDFSFIRIFYCTDPAKINTNIQQMKALYPQGVK